MSQVLKEADYFSTISRIYKQFTTFELLDKELSKIIKDDPGFLGKLTEGTERW